MDSVSVGRMGKIVVNGDSFVHERHFAKGEAYIEKTWAYKLGAVNLALSGSSNERIFYSTIEYLNKNDPDVLIIGWTSWDRYTLPNKNGLSLHLSTGNKQEPFFDDFIDTGLDTEPYYKFYIKNIYNPFINYTKFLNYHFHLEKYCKKSKIKFLNFMTWKNLPGSTEINQIAKTGYHDNIDDPEHYRKILDKQMSYINKDVWVNKQIGLCMNDVVSHLPKWKSESEQGLHPGIEASEYWLEIIKKNLN